MTLYRRQGSRLSPRKRNAKEQNGCLRRPYNSCLMKRSKKQKRKGKIYQFECRVPKNTRRDKKAFFRDQCKEIEENNRMGKTRSLQENQRYQGIFHGKMGTIRDRNGMDLTEAEDIKKRCKNTQKNCTKKISMTQINQWCDHSPRARHPGI